MRWFLAGLAFAAVVALAIATAAIDARNVHRRQRLQWLAERLEASRIALVAEELRFEEATSLRSLVGHWMRLQREIEGEVRE